MSAAPQPKDQISDKYEIDARIGEGGMGIIFAATNTLTGKRVALKWMHQRFAQDEEAVGRFMREARAAGSIDHPNVVNIFDVGKHEGTPFLVMELLRGKPLDELMADGPMVPAEIVDILVPAMRGIAAAHRLGIIHRDLKPENIFICMDAKGRRKDAKVLDFGISKAFDAENVLPSVTRTGTIIGTPAYMSPEQITGSTNLDRRTDVYALGVILYQALTGKLPFRSELFTALAVEIATAKVQPPREIVPELDPELEKIVLSAIARERRERFPDITSLAIALEPFGNTKYGEALSDRPPPPEEERRERETAATLQASPPPPPALASGAETGPDGAPRVSDVYPSGEHAVSSRRPLVIGAIALGAVLLSGIIAFAVWPDPEETEPPPPIEERSAVQEEEPAEVAPPEPARVEEPAALEEPEIPEALDPPPEMAEEPQPRRRRAHPAATAESPAQPAGRGERSRAQGRRTGGVSIDEF